MVGNKATTGTDIVSVTVYYSHALLGLTASRDISLSSRDGWGSSSATGGTVEAVEVSIKSDGW